jgi:hypothetical protein
MSLYHRKRDSQPFATHLSIPISNEASSPSKETFTKPARPINRYLTSLNPSSPTSSIPQSNSKFSINPLSITRYLRRKKYFPIFLIFIVGLFVYLNNLFPTSDSVTGFSLSQYASPLTGRGSNSLQDQINQNPLIPKPPSAVSPPHEEQDEQYPPSRTVREDPISNYNESAGIVAFPLSLLSQPTPAVHPIYELIKRNKKAWNEKLSRQSRTLGEAVKEYKRRYGMEPPRGFDVW